MTFVNPEAANFTPHFEKSYEKHRDLYDVTTSGQAGMVTMQMNKQHKFNIFTKGYLKQLDRTLNACEMTEDEIKLIRFMANDEHTFSRGTDFKTLHYNAANKDMDPIVEYLNGLFNFQIAYARNNKPLISTIKGRIENSANCLVGSSGISCLSQDTQLVFNEANYKNRLVPHAGASYFLTRMPGEFGKFLALTCTPFTGSEAQGVLGLADHILNWNSNLEGN